MTLGNSFKTSLESTSIPFRQSIAEDQPESVDRWGRARKPIRISETFTGFFCSIFLGVHPRKQTWQWKIHHLKMYFLLNIGMFHCHVSLFGLQPSDTFAAKHRVCGTVGRWYIPFWMASWESGFVVSKFDAYQNCCAYWLVFSELYASWLMNLVSPDYQMLPWMLHSGKLT